MIFEGSHTFWCETLRVLVIPFGEYPTPPARHAILDRSNFELRFRPLDRHPGQPSLGYTTLALLGRLGAVHEEIEQEIPRLIKCVGFAVISEVSATARMSRAVPSMRSPHTATDALMSALPGIGTNSRE